jgi:deazaflavin-dependent oxidoreductase (nitroreductase family)
MSTVEPPHDSNFVAESPSRFANEQYCYLTTTGRVTGQPHRIEIWFAIDQGTLYMLSGGRDRSDWVKNVHHDPVVTVEIRTSKSQGRARVVTDPTESEHARTLVHDKYAPGYRGDLTSWRRRSLPIAVDLERPTVGAAAWSGGALLPRACHPRCEADPRRGSHPGPEFSVDA